MSGLNRMMRSASIETMSPADQAALLLSRITLQSTPKPLLDTPTASLVYTTSYGGTVVFSLIDEVTMIGRVETNAVALACLKISKVHAKIIREMHDGEAEYSIIDLHSSNGVRLNEDLIVPGRTYQLFSSDTLSIGSIILTFTTELSPLSPLAPLVPLLVPQNLQLVTILADTVEPESLTIHQQLPATPTDFPELTPATSLTTLQTDYEKLRLVHELSKISLTDDITHLLQKTLDLIFELVPVDRGVFLLVDKTTRIMSTHFVKIRDGKSYEGREIVLSSTIMKRVLDTRVSLITTDAIEDPLLGSESIKVQQIRSVICVPLIAHDIVHGILHLDSCNKINAFSTKDLGLVKAISNQTAIALENHMLIKEVEMNAKITEQLQRFLAPHVVERMKDKSEIIRRGGRMLVGTVVFVDIRGFTNLSERCTPMEVVNLLNDYFERLVNIVFKYEGVVDKYIGDALMATFGTLQGEIDAEVRAVSACLEFIAAIESMNAERVLSGKEAIVVGVGVNTGISLATRCLTQGELLSGFIGCSKRLEYTVIGDTVNTASRICDQASQSVLISEMTYAKIKGFFRVESVGFKMFKGKDKGVMIYKVSRFSRQLLLDQISVSGQIALLNARVLVVGTGGLGAPVLLYLAAAGVGTLGILDFDVVEESNLHRQIIHTEPLINTPKSLSAAHAVNALNSKCIAIPHTLLLDSSNALEILADYDIIVDASDNVATRYLLNDASIILKKPLVSGSALRFDGQLTVYGVGDGPCYRCIFPVPPPKETVTNCNDGGVLGPSTDIISTTNQLVTGVIGSLQALEVIKLITGLYANYHKKMLLFDGETGAFKSVKLRGKRENCAVCGTNPTIVKLIDYVEFCGSGPNDKARNLQILKADQRISVQEYHDIASTGMPHVLLDVRAAVQVRICALDKCAFIPFKELSKRTNELKELVSEIAIKLGVRDEFVPIYVICRRGNESQLAVNLLRQTVFCDQAVVKDIIGGITAWSQVEMGFPTY